MALRSFRERMLQTVCFQGGGILLVAPLYSVMLSAPVKEGLALIAVLAAAILVWSPLHNFIFDLIELRMTGRLASDRPHPIRLVHALSHEVTSTLVTVPLIMAFAEFGFRQALALDIGLTIAYTGYAYVYFLLYDRIRPMRPLRDPVAVHQPRPNLRHGSAWRASAPDLDSSTRSQPRKAARGG